MKSFFLSLSILFCLYQLCISKQKEVTDCIPCTATLTIDTNSILTHLIPQGILKQRLNDSENGPSLLSQSNIWIGGKDPTGTIKFAGEIPEKAGNDFYPGPLDYINGLTNFSTCSDWDRFFLMKRDDVCDINRLYYKYVFFDNGVIPEDSIPISIKSWPAMGNPYFEKAVGFSLPENGREMANYYDQSRTGTFRPDLGDFPNIWNFKACIDESRDISLERVPDEFAYCIFNDAGGAHTNSQSNTLNLEVHGMFFANDAKGIIGKSIVHMYRLKSMGFASITDTYIGLNLNPHIGCSEDDFFGIDPDKNLFYSYNKDEFDGSNNCVCIDSSQQTWCTSNPMHGIKILDQIKAKKKITINNLGDTLLIDPIFSINPDTVIDLDIGHLTYYDTCLEPNNDSFEICMPKDFAGNYELLKGRFTNGTPITYGGNGYNLGSIDTVNMVFPTSPNIGD